MKVKVIKSTKNESSKQYTPTKPLRVDIVEPNIQFKGLLDIYKKSFVAAWITDKIATSLLTWFICDNENLKRKVEAIDYPFLIKNLVSTWNSFFEVIRNWKWEVAELSPILTETIRMDIHKNFIQNNFKNKAEFNKFTPISQRDDHFNTEKNEVYHFKTMSLRNKFYWDSLFEGVIDQLALINYIDNYYSSYFENQAIRPNVFTDPEWKLTNKDKEVISEFFKSKMKWVDKAFSTAIIPTNLQKLDLGDEINTESFINYRKELIKSVCIKLNIPSELLLSENSNRATAWVAKELFNKHTVKPLQEKILRDLKIIFSEEEWIESLRFKEIDTKDQKEEAEVYRLYIESWIITPEEARIALGIKKRL